MSIKQEFMATVAIVLAILLFGFFALPKMESLMLIVPIVLVMVLAGGTLLGKVLTMRATLR
ncbi:hypothetical protein [Metasolibacillus sp. FSL K6-0083]